MRPIVAPLRLSFPSFNNLPIAIIKLLSLKMPARTVQNPSALIGNVPVLDGNSVTFPAWRTRLEDLLAIQGVHDVVTGKLSRPETDCKDAKPVAQGSQRVYFAEESGTDWDSLSKVARATMKMTLSVDLAI
jgi:hypothetical protein